MHTVNLDTKKTCSTKSSHIVFTANFGIMIYGICYNCKKIDVRKSGDTSDNRHSEWLQSIKDRVGLGVIGSGLHS